MKKLYRLSSLVSGGFVFVSLFASKVYAAAGANICPTNENGVPVGLCSLQLGTALPNILNILLFVAFIAALVFLIYGGIRWILSGGDKEGTAKAKATVTSALVGLAIVLGSWLLINVILGIFGLSTGSITTVPSIIKQ